MPTFDEIFDAAGVERSRGPDGFTWNDLRRVARYMENRNKEEKEERADTTRVVPPCGNVYTTAGEAFTPNDHAVLAALVYIRMGRDKEAAAEAWRRMLGNGTTPEEFLNLAVPGCSLVHAPRKLWN